MPTTFISQPGQALVIPAHVVWNDVAGELVLFNSDDGTYHTLNAVGSHLWRAIAAGGTLASVTDSLCLAYQQDEAVIAADVRRFIEHALDKKLLKTHALAL